MVHAAYILGRDKPYLGNVINFISLILSYGTYESFERVNFEIAAQRDGWRLITNKYV